MTLHVIIGDHGLPPRLRSAQGTEAGRVFLDLMIAHHEGGVAMAEVAVLRDMLTARGGAATGSWGPVGHRVAPPR